MEQNLIVSDPAVMMGKAVVKGTRITVESDSGETGSRRDNG